VTAESTKRRRPFRRRLERWVLGVGMGLVAWVIERRVLGALKAKGKKPPAAARDHVVGEVDPREGTASTSGD